MIARIKRALRGQWPDRNETWAEYMGRKIDLPLAIGCCFGVVGLMLVLAEALDRGLK